MSKFFSHRGSCGCGWRGPWRATDSDAKADVQKHCDETGCLDQSKPEDLGDLMPHENHQKQTHNQEQTP
ncbi:hypothetical protein LCGC14_0663200 [marine sediment metagenome]|uniref:Uncharacterized protein n=1 Tax=marine sediment metagenome TaxID=412755 RepID=A0A0F9RD38_9ZZZZ